MLFFGGYGVQVGRESFMIPVDAAIWKEATSAASALSESGAGHHQGEGCQGQARRGRRFPP